MLWTHPQINAEAKKKIIKKLVARIELDVMRCLLNFEQKGKLELKKIK